ncbi:MAG: bile acid:sodium symporter family protein [Thermoleophilaceae bacterium]|nr:bile acid:sodium symporter family protein [Thermoleophilaceae bacterium]
MEDGNLFTDALLPLAVAIIMGSLGLTLTREDFRRVITVPRAVAIGLVNLLVVSPLLAFGAAEAFGLSAVFAVGLVLLGASPGGAMANLLTHLAKGEVALSVTMTAVSSVLAVITIPIYLGLAADFFDAADVSDQIDIVPVAIRVVLITIVPLSIGMYLRSRDPEGTDRRLPLMKRITMGVFVVVVAGAVISEFQMIKENFTDVALAALTLNVLAMTVSFTVAHLSRLNDRQATAIAMELGVHNSTVAIAVAASVNTELAVPAAVYSAFMFITAGAFARIMSRRNSPTAPPSQQAAPA